MAGGGRPYDDLIVYKKCSPAGNTWLRTKRLLYFTKQLLHFTRSLLYFTKQLLHFTKSLLYFLKKLLHFTKSVDVYLYVTIVAFENASCKVCTQVHRLEMPVSK